MSLDGFVAAEGVDMANPLGKDGDRLHDWIFSHPDTTDRMLVQELFLSAGAFVMGRRTFDVGERYWGDDGTFHPKRNSPMFTRVPIFALLSFCAALLTLYDRFLSWAVITVIGCVPLCMSSTCTVKRQGLLNVLRQAKHTSPTSLAVKLGRTMGAT